MKRRYYPIFTALGVGYGVLLYLVGREVLVNAIDTAALTPQFQNATIVVNVVALVVVCSLIALGISSLLRALRIHKM